MLAVVSILYATVGNKLVVQMLLIKRLKKTTRMLLQNPSILLLTVSCTDDYDTSAGERERGNINI